MATAEVQVVNSQQNLMEIFDFVNRHLTVMERSYQKPLIADRIDDRRVVIPSPVDKSQEEYLSRFISASQLVRVGPAQSAELEGVECLICLEGLKTNQVMRILKCDHLFHQSCVDRWLNDHRDTLPCPICRRSQYEEKLY